MLPPLHKASKLATLKIVKSNKIWNEMRIHLTGNGPFAHSWNTWTHMAMQFCWVQTGQTVNGGSFTAVLCSSSLWSGLFSACCKYLNSLEILTSQQNSVKFTFFLSFFLFQKNTVFLSLRVWYHSERLVWKPPGGVHLPSCVVYL